MRRRRPAIDASGGRFGGEEARSARAELGVVTRDPEESRSSWGDADPAREPSRRVQEGASTKDPVLADPCAFPATGDGPRREVPALVRVPSERHEAHTRGLLEDDGLANVIREDRCRGHPLEGPHVVEEDAIERSATG